MALQRTKQARQDDANVTRLHDVADLGGARIGADLRGARQRRGLAIDDVAKRLRIGVDFLQAMEEGRFEALPGRTYVVGFLRSYAEFLGLDGKAIVERYRDEAGAAHGPAELNFPEPLAPPSLPTGRIVLVALVLGAVVVAGWSIVHDRATPLFERVAQVPADLLGTAEPSSEPAADAATADAAAAAEPAIVATAEPEPVAETVATEAAPAEPAVVAAVPVEPVAVEPLPVEPSAAEATVPTEPAEPVVATAEPAVATAEPVVPVPTEPAQPAAEGGYVPNVYGGATPGRIVITATADSWVQVSRADGSAVFTRILEPGDIYHVPDDPGLALRTGNAGGLTITVDGAAVPAVGGANEVRRGIALDPDRLKAGTAVP
jgi:cytoskeleton protein RodZ